MADRSVGRTRPTDAPGAGCFSCVIDDHPRFQLEALRWFTSLTELAGVEPGDLVVHVVGPTSTEALDYLRGRGVAIVGVGRFDPRSPHCNKVAAALALAKVGVDGVAVLSDTDVAFLEDPRRLAVPDAAVAGKPVDAPVPPPEVVEAIFDAAHLRRPARVPLAGEESTVAGNFNGGLYLVPGKQLARVATAWASWARWLLDRAELLEEWTVYVDQVAMALGLADVGLDALLLEIRWNTPVHDASRIRADAPVPAMIHYHQQVDHRGKLTKTGVPSIDGQIDRVNQVVEEARLTDLAPPPVRDIEPPTSVEA